MKTVSFADLERADLVVDAVYEGGVDNTFGSDPFPKLLSLSNQGGFRFRGTLEKKLEMLMLYTTNADADWPDSVDLETGVFSYYGDNKKPGHALHDTGRQGNRILRSIFHSAYGGPEQRALVPPTFIFARYGDVGRNVKFLGLAVPGTSDVSEKGSLVALWRSSGGNRFQNYRALFSILDVPIIERQWLDSLIAGAPDERLAPDAWSEWLKTGKRRRLVAERSVEWRTPNEQKPLTKRDRMLVDVIISHFEASPYEFEHCAAKLTEMALPNVVSIEVTRRHRDGGRDAIGQYRIGSGPSSVLVDFALEAKCWSERGVGVKSLSRLISRLRHRQFGVLVTTSWLDRQAYQELKEDEHPIVVIAARDIVQILTDADISSPSELRDWLKAYFPIGC